MCEEERDIPLVDGRSSMGGSARKLSRRHRQMRHILNRWPLKDVRTVEKYKDSHRNLPAMVPAPTGVFEKSYSCSA